MDLVYSILYINQTFIFYQSKFKMLQGRILTYPPYIKALDPDTSTTNFTYNMEGNDCCQLRAWLIEVSFFQ